jgi:outer membrane protein OmpA-like peptidoglycan-associated protein
MNINRLLIGCCASILPFFSFAQHKKPLFPIFTTYFKPSICTLDRNQIEQVKTYVIGQLKLKKGSNYIITISGHADKNGSEKSNVELSKKRALSMKELLIENGISPNTIKIDVWGSGKPEKLSRDYKKKRIPLSNNRRVVVRVDEKNNPSI